MSNISAKIENLKLFRDFMDPSILVENKILEILGDFGKFPFGILTLEPNTKLIRLRPNETSSQEFLTRSELSYKPESFNTTYQRASTPGQTMFYGTIDESGSSEMPNRVTPALEALPWLRDDNSSGKQKVTYSIWTVKEKIKLIPIISHSPFTDSKVIRKHLPEFISYIVANSDRSDEVIEFLEFIANEFATPHKNDDQKNYLISSIFANLMLRNGDFDGVLYPSCQVNGVITNVALLPETVDQKMDLTFACECMIYKYNKKIHVANLRDSLKHDEKPLGTFSYVPVGLESSVPENVIYNDLGVSDLKFI